MKVITQNLYKYGSLHEINDIEFYNLIEAKNWVSRITNVGDEPKEEDFYDSDNEHDYQYYQSQWLQSKTATPDSVKWFAEFFYKGELLGKGVLDL